jgi:hypothetical protein
MSLKLRKINFNFAFKSQCFFMKTIKIKSAYILIVFFTISSSFAQVGIGIASPDTSAMLDVSSADKGFLPPRMDETARNNIGLPGTPATGLVIYNTTSNQLNYYNGAAWQILGTASGSYVDLTTNQTVAGNKTFSGTLIPAGRLMIPMGEISYFSSSDTGFLVNIDAKSTGTDSETDNMVKINPDPVSPAPRVTKFVNDMFGLSDADGADSKLTYQGTVGRYFHIALSFSYRPSTGRDVFIFGVARTTKRGEDAVRTTKVEDSSKLVITTGLQADYNSSAMHVLLFLDPGDSIEFYVGNVTAGRDVYIKSFNFVAIGM